MPIDPKFFKDYPDLVVGDRVRWARKLSMSNGHGEGVVFLIWFGIEEMCDIKEDDGKIVTFCRAIGDTVEKVK